MELIIQKSVELGVKRIVPVKCTRCVSKIDFANSQKKIERWQKIAFEAAKQSNRGIVPIVTMPVDFEDAILQEKEQLFGIIPYENEQKKNLKKILTDIEDTTNNIGIFVGPEGGFEEAEILFAKENGVIPVSMGPRILRTETAGLALISMVMYQCGDMGE
jgi:16S rRNA (uracil1498-N3)-methyltransferase